MTRLTNILLLLSLSLSLSTTVRAQQPDITALFDCGERVRIEATPLPGYRFVRWSDGDTARVRVVDVDGPIDLKAVFDVECHDVEVPVVLINDKMAAVDRRFLLDEGLITEALPEDSVRWYRQGKEGPIGSGFVLQLGANQDLKDYYVEVSILPEVAKAKFICSPVLRGYPIKPTDLPYISTPLHPYAQKIFKDGMIFIKRNKSLYTIDGQKLYQLDQPDTLDQLD